MASTVVGMPKMRYTVIMYTLVTTLNSLTFEDLKALWLKASSGFMVEIDCTDKPNGPTVVYILRNKLYNFRRTVRKQKLHPEWAELWTEIKKCQIVVISPTIIRIFLKY